MTLETAGNVRRLLVAHGLTQTKLAGELGVTQGAVSQWITTGNMSDENKVAVARRFGFTVDQLMTTVLFPEVEPAQSVHSACTAPE